MSGNYRHGKARARGKYYELLQQFRTREGADSVMRRAGFVRGAGCSHWVLPDAGARVGERKDRHGT